MSLNASVLRRRVLPRIYTDFTDFTQCASFPKSVMGTQKNTDFADAREKSLRFSAFTLAPGASAGEFTKDFFKVCLKSSSFCALDP
jgi:hypothetical protein